MQQRGQRLVDGKAQRRAQQALEHSEGQVKDDQAGQQAVHRWNQLLIHANNHIQRHKRRIDGVGNKIVDGYAEDAHADRPRQRANKRTLPGLHAPIEQSRRNHQGRADEEVAQLPDASGSGFEDHLDHVLNQTHGHAADRSNTEGSQQGGQLGEIHLHKGRDQERDRELQQLQHKGCCAQHGGNHQLVGSGDAGDRDDVGVCVS